MKTLLILAIYIALPLFSVAQTWQDVGGGTNNSSHGLLVWNGQLVNLGSFNNPCNRVAVWDGSNWSCLGGGVGIVARAGCVWNGNLVVVGDFWNVQLPCVDCHGIAMWDGTQWTNIGTGFNNDVLTVGVYNGDLIAGGDFTQADGMPCNRIARWNGTNWEQIGDVNDFDNDVRCMAVFEGELWIGGDFNNVGGNSPSDGVVKWDETTQTWIGGNYGVDLVGGVNETVRVLYVNPNDGNLYMGGEFPELIDGDAGVTDYNMSGIAMYDGSNWYPLGTGLNEYCRAIHEYNGNLIAGGYFTDAGGVACNKIAKWNGSTWSPMGLGFDAGGIDEYVKSATTWNGIFFAGGAYTQAEGNPMNYIAQWYEASSNPPAAFISNGASQICPNGCISFTDQSTNNPTSWDWSFPGASTTNSSAQNPGSICYPTSGTYTVQLIACNGNGCDTTTVDITVNTTYSQSEAVDICQGTDYTYPDGTTSSNITTSESHVSSLTAVTGCDSTITTNLTVLVPATYTENVNVCNGGDYTYPDGTTATSITANESHDSYLTGSNGCDSIVTTHLTVQAPITNSESIDVCNGGNHTYPDGTTSTNITANESHDSYLTTTNGCDSVVTTYVTVLSPITNTENIGICSGNNYTYPDGTTSTNVTSNESHTSYLTNGNGCDSIVTTNLTVTTVLTTSENVSVCAGDNYTYPDGSTSSNITSDESHTSTLAATGGCDSIVTTYITVNPIPTLTVTPAQTICEGTSATLSATPSDPGGMYTWTPGNETTASITISPAIGTTNYTVMYELNGCSTSGTTSVTTQPTPSTAVTVSNNVLTAQQTSSGYQWIDCTTGLEVSGETNQSFAPVYNGSFAVELDLNGCVDTSACETISTIGIEEFAANEITLLPNPVHGNLWIQSNHSLDGKQYVIFGADGKQILVGTLEESGKIDASDIAPGTYFLALEKGTPLRFVKL